MSADEAGALVSRTVRFGEYLDALPGRLVAQLLCEIRDLTAPEAEHLAGPYARQFDSSVAIQPVNPGAATLLIGRFSLEGGHACALAFGVHTRIEIPDSYAQPSDVHSDWMIEEATSLTRTVVDGCTEFRRPFVHDHLSGLLAIIGPPSTAHWSVGVESVRGRSSRTSDHEGEPFEQRWLPWHWRV